MNHYLGLHTLLPQHPEPLVQQMFKSSKELAYLITIRPQLEYQLRTSTCASRSDVWDPYQVDDIAKLEKVYCSAALVQLFKC